MNNTAFEITTSTPVTITLPSGFERWGFMAVIRPDGRVRMIAQSETFTWQGQVKTEKTIPAPTEGRWAAFTVVNGNLYWAERSDDETARLIAEFYYSHSLAELRGDND